MMTSIIAWATAAAMLTACGVQPKATTQQVSLENTRIGFIGDSICYGKNADGYAQIIGEEQNAEAVNISFGGSAFARGVKWSADSDGERPSIISMVQKLTGDFDYIVVEGGINDFWNHAPLGEISETFDGGYDEYTAIGAMEQIFHDLKYDHPKSKIGYVIQHNPFTYDAEDGYAKYYEAYKAVCEKWSVPYLDLYAVNNKNTGVNVRDAEQKALYFGTDTNPDGDGTHPNELGYRVIYAEPIVEWLKTL